MVHCWHLVVENLTQIYPLHTQQITSIEGYGFRQSFQLGASGDEKAQEDLRAQERPNEGPSRAQQRRIAGVGAGSRTPAPSQRVKGAARHSRALRLQGRIAAESATDRRLGRPPRAPHPRAPRSGGDSGPSGPERTADSVKFHDPSHLHLNS